jgi:excisionase family DNA binding protein
MAEEYLKYEEAADYYHTGADYILEQVKTGKLPVVVLGHKTRRIRRSDLDRFAEERLQPKPVAS